MSYDELKFEEIDSMTKEDAVIASKKFFKGNKKFLDYAIMLIYSTHGFIKVSSMTRNIDTFNWEKLLSISIDTEKGFKQFYYRKGNKKYRKTDNRPDGNETHEIEGYRLIIYDSNNHNAEEFEF
ncbi:hypothetical protein [Brevibacillus reuszeri]|uniref:hypothetical protein n=1 Tax=Brevibacillus reuszeri TaxID=54915 RepID=UPI000CCC168E|nr:hypothetical protein [Brevibacillus reuszeri]